MTFTILDEHVETASGKVSISIMHLGKGLEFRAVVVMACDDEIIPMQERIETDDDDLQEVYAGTDWPGTLDHAQQIAAHESPRNMSGFRARILGASRDDLDHPVDTFTDDADARRVVNVPVDAITPNPDQPRKYFDPQAVAELTESIRGHGVLQPIIVRRSGESSFTLIADERRWRAFKGAGFAKIPVLIRQKEDPAEIALIENMQRENLNPIEEAERLALLKERRALTDQQLASIVGKSRVAVNESLSLTRLAR